MSVTAVAESNNTTFKWESSPCDVYSVLLLCSPCLPESDLQENGITSPSY
jgi:hypothetical protein